MKKLLLVLLSLALIAALSFYFFVYPKFIIIAGYAAKNMCSCVFVAGIDEQKVRNEDLNFDILSLADTEVDYARQMVTATVFGLYPKTAWYQGPTGCTMVNEIDPQQAYRYRKDWQVTKHDSLADWFTYIDTVEYLNARQSAALDKALAAAFVENDPGKPKNTRAALVLYKGQLAGEQYAPGFNKDSRLMGWSMTKSLTATMLAMLVQEGKIDLKSPTGIAAWQHDERRTITWEQLLHMNSGLRWEEVYDQVSDAVLMLFNSDAIGEYAMQMPPAYPPNTQWVYSSGTTNIIATRMRDFFATTDDYVRYPYEKIFHRLGMYSMLIETDAYGRFVGSSYGWATARDWAKIGQLYLQNGNWAGEQLLPASWIDFVRQPAPNAKGLYGGHFWLNRGNRYPDAPADIFSMEGFHGQKVFIIPSKDLVVVRLGLTYQESDFDFNQWLQEIIAAIEN